MDLQQLIIAGIKSGISVPIDINDFDREVYPHFAVYYRLYLSILPKTYTNYFQTATVIARVPEEHIRHLTPAHFVALDLCSPEGLNVSEEDIHKAALDLVSWQHDFVAWNRSSKASVSRFAWNAVRVSSVQS